MSVRSSVPSSTAPCTRGRSRRARNGGTTDRPTPRSRTTASTPNAAALRNSTPRFSWSFTRSTTATRRAPGRAPRRGRAAATGRRRRPRRDGGRSRRPGGAPPLGDVDGDMRVSRAPRPAPLAASGVTRTERNRRPAPRDGLRSRAGSPPRRSPRPPPRPCGARDRAGRRSPRPAVILGIADVLEIGHRCACGVWGTMQTDFRSSGPDGAIRPTWGNVTNTPHRREPPQQASHRRRYRQIHGTREEGDLRQAAAVGGRSGLAGRRSRRRNIRSSAPAFGRSGAAEGTTHRDRPGRHSAVLDGETARAPVVAVAPRDRVLVCGGQPRLADRAGRQRPNHGRLDAVQLIADTTLVLMVLWLGKDDPNSAGLGRSSCSRCWRAPSASKRSVRS